MPDNPKNILKAFPMIRGKQQKQAFLDAVQSYLADLGYSSIRQTDHFGIINLVIGDPTNANFLVVAPYLNNISGVTLFLEIAAILGERERTPVCFVLLDRLGTLCYQKAYGKQTENQLVLYLENLGAGDNIRMIPTSRLRQDRKKLTALYKACGYFGSKSILVDEKSKLPFFSWLNRWPYAVCIRTRQEGKKKTPESMDLTNLNLLRAALATYLTQTEK